MKSDHSGGEEMLLRFTFVPRGLTRRPWRRRRRGARRPMRGEPRPMSRWPSPPRGASDRPPWGSGFALDRGRGRRETVIISVFCVFLSLSFLLKYFLHWIIKSVMRLKPRSQRTSAGLKTINRCHCCPLLEVLGDYMSWKCNLTY